MTESLLRNGLTLHGAIVALSLVFYVMASRTFPQRRDPSAAVAWVIALALLPYVALPLYVMFGSRKLLLRDPPQSRAALPQATEGFDPQAMWAQRLGHAMGLPDAASYRHLAIHANGADALRALHDVIGGARHSLDVCTFILADDAVGAALSAALQERARSGVATRLMVDGIGALLGGRVDYDTLRAAGVQVVKFVPPFRSILRGRANLRNHRKLVIADATRVWCGGRNLAAEYFGGPEGPSRRAGAGGSAEWHDLSFDFRGELAIDACRQFDLDWAYATRVPTEARVAIGRIAAYGSTDTIGSGNAREVEMPAMTTMPGPCHAPRGSGDSTDNTDALAGLLPLAQLVPSGPDQVDDTVQVLLVSGAFMARRRIVAVTPYFVPDATLLQALTLAARRGVAVDLVLPERSNHRLADLARNRPLRELYAAGVRVWLVPHMLHAKAVVIDDEIALVGSANLDARSLFLNYELMVAFYEPDDVRRFAGWIEGERRLARPYLATPPGLLRDLTEGIVLWLAFQL